MSVTVEDLLRLPSLRGAELVAGRGAGKKLVSSISVLEYADPNVLQAELFRNNEFFGSEIVITGFLNIPRDVEAQCANLRRLADAGEVGLILFYVGVFMPEVDPKLMALADEKDFALIVMPRGRMDLRYSDVICEVMEAIFQDQNNSTLLVSDILGRTALLPEHQRTLDTVLKLLSDRLRATVLLTDGALRPLNAIPWPRAEDTRLPEALRALEALPPSGGTPATLRCDGRSYAVYRQTLTGGSLELFLFKEGAPLPPDLIRRAGEVVHLASSIWSQGHSQVVMSELVRAILRDEPVKMRRLAELFHVDVASMHVMWVLRCGSSDPQSFQAEGLDLVQKLLGGRCSAMGRLLRGRRGGLPGLEGTAGRDAGSGRGVLRPPGCSRAGRLAHPGAKSCHHGRRAPCLSDHVRLPGRRAANLAGAAVVFPGANGLYRCLSGDPGKGRGGDPAAAGGAALAAGRDGDGSLWNAVRLLPGCREQPQ